MKKFFAGALCATLVFSLAVSALAISEKMTIDVYPINILVNGQVFAPTDAQGNPVDVFTYKGTTYAPLRALAEAYGLEVGYDAASKTATVVDPDAKQTSAPVATQPDYSDWSEEEEAAYQEFKGMWEIELRDKVTNEYGEVWRMMFARYNGDLDDNMLKEQLDKIGGATLDIYAERMMTEVYDNESALQLLFANSQNWFWTVAIYDFDGDGNLDISTDYENRSH